MVYFPCIQKGSADFIQVLKAGSSAIWGRTEGPCTVWALLATWCTWVSSVLKCHTLAFLEGLETFAKCSSCDVIRTMSCDCVEKHSPLQPEALTPTVALVLDASIWIRSLTTSKVATSNTCPKQQFFTQAGVCNKLYVQSYKHDTADTIS